MAEAFKFELVSPSRLVLSEMVDQVVVPGTEGYFTVLKGHSPLMSTIRPGVVEVTTPNGATAKFLIVGGFADVSPAGLTILAEQAIPVEELTPDAISRLVSEGEAALAAAKSDEAKRVAKERYDQLREAIVGVEATSPAH